MGPLSDSNILLRLSQPGHPHHAPAKAAVARLALDGERIYVVPQNIVEFWGVATRPPEARGGLGYTLEEAYGVIKGYLNVFTLLADGPTIHDEWQDLVRTVGARGAQVHDARLVACMRVHGITRILTFNGRDFGRYPGVEVLDPDVLAGS